ncbi:hypothetical protein CSV75_08645 [Sporosarcina sp. P18a]|uniref:hypothetical protein n=1 Tax=Sporosarcina sp. P18a TaxID=2048259 RepID=UPI000C1645DE|nr:hypothetical protein [Sporosarcina sp. P18a]PIC80028.1 hypothetical protein CSV75_08645 [Sporosarcina sp. P18a]
MTKKPFKVLSKASLAGVLAVSALVPVAAASAATSYAVDEIVVTVDGQNVAITKAVYDAAIAEGWMTGKTVSYVQNSDGKYYSKAVLDEAVSEEATLDKALELLAGSDKAETITTVPGEFVGGSLVPEKEQIAGLKVESVMAINNNAVTVTFPEITTAIEDANVVVKDGEGKVVETKPMLLAEGTTQADFEFVTPFPVDHKFTGVWDVNGEKYSFDAINQLADIAAAVTTPNEIKLQAALDAAGITYADETRIAAYLGALQVEGATASLEAVQKAITKIDEDAAKDEANDAAVEAVLDAKTQAQLLKALQANFDVVNPEWIVEYQAAIGGIVAPTTVDAIQEEVTEVNTLKVGPKVSAANLSLDSEKVAEARALVTKWIPADKEDAEPLKALILDGLNLEDALIAVNNAKTNSALKSALTNLDTLENSLLEKYKDVVGFDKIDEFDIKTVEDANLTAYRTAIGEAEVGDKNQRKDIQKIVNDKNDEAVGSAKTKVLEDLNAVTAKTAAADVVALLEKSQKLHEQTNKVNSAYAEAYKTAVVEAVAGEETLADAGEVNTLIGTVNAAQDAKAQLAAINAASTASEMSKALIALEAANNKTNFTNLSSTAKLEVAEIVLAKRNAETDKKFADKDTALAAIFVDADPDTGAIAERTAFLADVNDETSIAGVQTVLAGENSLLPEFKTLGAADQVEKAEAVLNALTALKADGKAGFSTVTEIKTIVE